MTENKALPTMFNGQCPCGAVQFELAVNNWEDLTQIYCHCGDCRRWHSAPFVSEVILYKGALKTTKVCRAVEKTQKICCSNYLEIQPPRARSKLWFRGKTALSFVDKRQQDASEDSAKNVALAWPPDLVTRSLLKDFFLGYSLRSHSKRRSIFITTKKLSQSKTDCSSTSDHLLKWVATARKYCRNKFIYSY